MLKTFIASIRSDKAVKELDKIGVKVKEVGEDGVERFRDIQQVILDIAIKTKYSEKDMQKVLLAISGGKFQWSKVSAMLKDYEEIMNNWELAIASQGFTDKQVEAQLDTVARKFQTLKDQLTGLIVNGGEGNIGGVLKAVLDGVNTLLRVFNEADTTILKVITLIGSSAAVLYGFKKALAACGVDMFKLSARTRLFRMNLKAVATGTKTLNISLRAMGTVGEAAFTKIRLAMARIPQLLAAMAVMEGLVRVIEWLDLAKKSVSELADEQLKEYDIRMREKEVAQEKLKYTKALISSYSSLLEASKNTSLSEEKKADLNDKIAETEKKLSVAIGDEAVQRIKSSEDVMEQGKAEVQQVEQDTQAKIDAADEYRDTIITQGKELQAEAMRLMKQYRDDKNAYIEGLKQKTIALSDFISFEQAYYAFRAQLETRGAEAAEYRLKDVEKRLATAEKQLNENPNNGAVQRTYNSVLSEYNNLKERLESAKEWHENQADEFRKMSAEARFGPLYKEAMDKFEAAQKLGVKVKTDDDESNEKQTNEPDDKSKGSKGDRSGSRRDTTKYHDPVFDHIAALLKSIDETTQRQEKIFDRQVNRKGYSKDTLEKQWKVYSETLSQLRKLKEDNAKHGREVLSNVYKDGVMVDTIDDDVNSSIAEWAKKEGDKWQGKFTDDLEKQCDSFVAAFYEELGLTKANGQKFGDDIARGGDFGGAYHSIGDGYKPQPGDFIDWGHHVGIYVGGGKYLARNSKGGIHIGSMEGMESEFGKLEGYGAIRELPNRYALPVDIKELLDKRNGNGVTLKDMPAEELIKALEDIRDNTFEVDSETGVMTSKPRTEGDTDLSKEQKLAITQLISILKTEVTQNNSIDDNYAKTEDNQRSKYLAGIKDIMSEDKESIARYYEDLDEMFRGGRSSFEEAQNAFNKATLEVTLYSNTIEDLKAKGIKGKKELKEFTDGLRSANKAQREALLKMKQNYFSDFNSKAEHEYNMQDFRSKNDPFGRKKATAELDKFAQELSALYVKRMSMYNELTLEEQYKLDEEIKTMQEKLDEGLNAYHDKLMAGYNSIVQDLIFQGKNLKEVLSELWQSLGKDAWEKLFTGNISNPSFLTQMLGFGRPDKNRADYDKLINSNITDMLAESYNFLGKSNGNLGQKILDMKDKLGEGMSLVDSKAALQIANNNMLQANTIALQQLSATMGVQAATNSVSNAAGWFGSLGSAIGTFYAPGGGAASPVGAVTKMLRGTATGGRLGVDGKPMLSKFADGGAMASGKIQGAGTGRSDSILAYLANKDKFVWLSNGEYVINEKSAKALGYDTLDSLNKYADGGALQTSVTNPTPYIPTINPQVAQKATTIHGSNKITEALLREQNKHMMEQNEMLRNMSNSSDGGGKMVVLNTQASSADVLRALQENPRALQAILGRQKSMGFR